jgi:hypothetical protein
MADQKLLKVTNRATGQVWMKTPEQVEALKKNKIMAPRFSFEKEVPAPEMAAKISAPKKKDEAPTEAPKE